MHFEDQVLLNEIRLRNLKVYEALFSYYYPQLLRFAESYVFDKQECEDITQNILIYFWENAEKINIDLSLRAYFFSISQKQMSKPFARSSNPRSL